MASRLTGSDIPALGDDTVGRVVVADDDMDACEYIRAMLEMHGHTVRTAADGEGAMQLCVDFDPHVVLLDVVMPGMDGPAVCRLIRESPASSHLPVILVTAHGSRDERLRGIRAGANDFLTKPVDLRDLQLRVRNMVYLKKLFDRIRDDHARLSDLRGLRDNLNGLIVHDMSAPLDTIGAALAGEGPLVEAGRGALAMLREMTRALLDISLVEFDRLRPERGRCDLCALTTAAVAKARVLAGSVERVCYTAEEGVWVACDPALTERVLRTMLWNALKASPEGAAIDVAVASAADSACVSVVDRGPGIPPELHAAVLDKHRYDALHGARMPRASSLPLTFCRLVAEAQGGGLELSSDVGQQTEFRLRLPKWVEPTPGNPDGEGETKAP